jgi:hypothetical protein
MRLAAGETTQLVQALTRHRGRADFGHRIGVVEPQVEGLGVAAAGGCDDGRLLEQAEGVVGACRVPGLARRGEQVNDGAVVPSRGAPVRGQSRRLVGPRLQEVRHAGVQRARDGLGQMLQCRFGIDVVHDALSAEQALLLEHRP